METSLSMKTTDTTGKKNTTTLSYVNPNASNNLLKTYAEKLASLTSDTYNGATKIEKTNLDEESTKTARTGYIISGVEKDPRDTITSAINVNSLGAYDYNEEKQLFGFNFTGDNAPIHVITGADCTPQFMITAPTSPPGPQQPSLCEHPFTVALFSAEDTISGSYPVTLRVDESETYQALDIVITITGGEG